MRVKGINELAHMLNITSLPAIILSKDLWLIPLEVWFTKYL